MRAIEYYQYGEPKVLKYVELMKPTPSYNEILVKIHATSVSRGDVRLRKADPFLARLYNGLFFPRKVRVLGFEYAGVVEAIGKDVTQYKVGDKVYAFTGFHFGAYAEYACIQVSGKVLNGLVAKMPANMTFEEAAVVPTSGITALSAIQKAGITKGQKVLIYGASGSVGTFAVQFAKYYGAEVTGVCSTQNLAMVKSIGADQVIDYTKDDFSKSEVRYDFVYDAVGKASKKNCRAVIKEGGIIISVNRNPSVSEDALDTISAMIEEEKVKSVIDKTYTFDQIPEAHAYVEKGHKRGNVSVIVVKKD